MNKNLSRYLCRVFDLQKMWLKLGAENDNNKMFILGYMLGIQQERQKVKTEV